MEESFADGHYRLKLKAPADIDIKHDLARFVAENSWLITNLYTERKSLEEIFHRLTQETEDILVQQQASEADMIMDIDQQLQEELVSTENKVGFARQFYNDIATGFNTAQQMFPGNIIATSFPFRASAAAISVPMKPPPITANF